MRRRKAELTSGGGDGEVYKRVILELNPAKYSIFQREVVGKRTGLF